MNRFLTNELAALVLLASSAALLAHDPRLHQPNSLTGEIIAVSADGMQLKTRNGEFTVKFSSKTTFEHDKKMVDKSHVRKGDRAGVVGTKLPSGEWIAKEVLLGLAPAQSGQSKQNPGTKDPPHKH